MKLAPRFIRHCLFVGPTRRELKAFPDEVRGGIGHALHQAQSGDEPDSAKALKGFGGRSVLEIVADFDGNTYRAVYTVRFADVIYVLHAFQKKSKRGHRDAETCHRPYKVALTGCRSRLPGAKERTGIQVMKKHQMKVEAGSGNIFADLGLPDAEDMLLKSTLVIELRRLIKQRKLTQTAAAKLIGIGQADLSKILRGQFRGYSEARLMRMLTAFDQDVEITTRPHRRSGGTGRIIFSPRAA